MNEASGKFLKNGFLDLVKVREFTERKLFLTFLPAKAALNMIVYQTCCLQV